MRRPFLNRLMALQARGQVPDGAGGRTGGWSELGKLWCEVRRGGISAREGEAGRMARATHRIVVRGAPEGDAGRPEAGQRFAAGGRVFAVLWVGEADPGGAYLECAVEEVAAT